MALALLVATLLRGVTPLGWMPNPEGGRGAPFVICTGAGSRLVQLDAQGHPAAPHSNRRHDVCAFAGHHAASPPAAVEVANLIAWAGFQPPRLVASASPGTAARHREQSQRAPPLLV